jgi:hypothetical protein
MAFMRKFVLAVTLFSASVGLVGCGPSVDDPGRVPEGAADTSDPTKVNMGVVAPGAPGKAQAGPSGAPATPPATK